MKVQVLVTAAILAGTPVQAGPPSEQTRTKQGDEQVTVSGCVQREADYRRARDKGRGGVAGTGLGVENEYVLNVSAKTSYELTGANEKLAGPHVGHRVEISGTLKAAEVTDSGATGGATAGKPPRGIDVVSKDLRLRELEVATVKMISADCTPK